MAFFSLGKKKKEDPISDVPMSSFEAPPQAPSLMDQVTGMRQQGYTNDQIAQMLQGQGYNYAQISDAINQSGLGANFQQMPPQDAGPQDYQQYNQPYPDQPQQYEQQMPQQPYPQQNYQQQQEQPINEERMQELAEAIIDEKWEEFAKDIKKVIEWKDKTEDRIAKVEQQILDMRLAMESLSKSIMTKITSYDQNIVDVGTEVKAMEKVFQKVLPSLTESVNKLDRMTKGYNEPVKK